MLFTQAHLAGTLTPGTMATSLGGEIDGSLREYGTFNKEGSVEMPQALTFKGASTLTCADLTAWNALYRLGSNALKPGDVVPTQGTGGVSIFALQVRSAAHQLIYPECFD